MSTFDILSTHLVTDLLFTAIVYFEFHVSPLRRTQVMMTVSAMMVLVIITKPLLSEHIYQAVQIFSYLGIMFYARYASKKD
jgi:hypothetical protein